MSFGDNIASLNRSLDDFCIPRCATAQNLRNKARKFMEIEKRIEELRSRIIPGTEESRQYELTRQRCDFVKSELTSEARRAQRAASVRDKQLIDDVLSKLVMQVPRQGRQKRKAEDNNDEVDVKRKRYSSPQLHVFQQDVSNLVMLVESSLQDPSLDMPRLESMLREIERCHQHIKDLPDSTINFDQLQALRSAVIAARDELFQKQVGHLESDERLEDDMNPLEVLVERARHEEQVQPVTGAKEVIEVVQQAKDTMVAECEMIVEYLHTGVQQLTKVLSEEIVPTEKNAVQAQVDKELLREVDDALEQVRKRGAVNFRLENGFTPLIVIAAYGSAEQVQTLLEADADVKYSSEDGVTPLISAIRYGTIDTVRILLKNGAKVDGSTVMYAIEVGRVDIVRLLMGTEVDRTFISGEGWTLLAFATRTGSVELVSCLLDAGVDVNFCASDKRSALMEAVLSDNVNVNVIKALLEAGAKVNAQDFAGYTALIFAADRGHKGVVEVLLEAEAKVDIENKAEGTALMFAADRGHKGVVEVLLEARAKVDIKDETGRTALILAAAKGHKDIVEVLLEAGAKVDVQDVECFTALMHAAEKGHKGVVETLLKAKSIDVNFRNERGLTSLFMAILHGNVEVAELLMRAGADTNIKDLHGISPLVMARYVLSRDKYEKIKALLSVDSKLLAEHQKIYRRAAVFVNASSKFKKRFTYKDTQGKTMSIKVEGLYGKSNYFSKIMGKNWRRYMEEHPRFLPEKTVKRVESALELNQRSLDVPVEDIVERYLDGNPVIISTGFSSHRVNVVLSDGFILLANRGASMRKTTLEVFRFIDGKDKDPAFLKDYISRFHQLHNGSKDEYEAFVEKEFSASYYQQDDAEVGSIMEKTLSLLPQTIGNCPWANLEQAIIGLMGLEAVLGKVAGNQFPSKGNIKKILLKEVEKFKEFTSYQVKMAFEKFNVLLLQRKCRDSRWDLDIPLSLES